MAFQFITPYSVRIGVVGAGTMGSGIALAVLLSGMPVTLYDVSEPMLEKAREYIRNHLERKGKAGELKNLELTGELSALSGAGIVIEAAPEDLGLKQELFTRLDSICRPPAILATNTSTLAVTAIASASGSPERVAGMHFFNPAAVLPLVEVIRGARTSPDTILTLVRLAEKIGKTPVVAGDTPGFIVNRVARPFYGEALRLFGEKVASVQDIDRVVRMGGGFRMGPFQLMDLIGIDVNLAAMQSMYEQTFEEPRYRPHRIQIQMVQQNALGRKTGRGFYTYEIGSLPEDPTPPKPEKNSGRLFLSAGSWAPGFGQEIHQHGYSQTRENSERNGDPLIAIVRLGRAEGLRKFIVEYERSLPAHIPLLCQCVDVTLTEVASWIRHPERLAGFDGLFFTGGSIATLVPSPTLMPHVRQKVEAFIASLGRLCVWIQDSPGLVLPRIVCMLANEASFALTEGVAEAEKIDLAMRLGVNYPKGPLSWAKEIGYTQIVEVLDHLRAEYGEERYRVAPILRRWARIEQISA